MDTPAVSPAASPLDAATLMEHLREEQDWQAAMLAGTAVAVACAFAWAAITYAADMQIGYMAIAAGAAIGVTVRHFGKGIDTRFGILGAALAVGSVLGGNVLAVVAFAARQLDQPFLTTLARFDWSVAPRILGNFLGPIDLLFYGIAVYEGYRFSFRKLTAQLARPGQGTTAQLTG